MNALVDQVEVCGRCQPAHDCDACGGSGLCWPWAPAGDPDWCPACGGCGSDWVPAHPIGEAQA